MKNHRSRSISLFLFLGATVGASVSSACSLIELETSKPWSTVNEAGAGGGTGAAGGASTTGVTAPGGAEAAGGETASGGEAPTGGAPTIPGGGGAGGEEPACTDELVLCGTQCVDVLSNPAHCGACNEACGPGSLCDGTGSCVVICQSGTTNCDGSCVDTQTDEHNCGSCGTICPMGTECQTGSCLLPPTPITMIDARHGHTCAVFAQNANHPGALKCWGANTFGQLGLGHTASWGDNATDLSRNWPVVNLGTGRGVRTVSVGQTHTCAILDDYSVKCWGANSDTQLGLGDTKNRGDGADEMGDHLPTVDLGTNRSARQLAAGVYHSCAILDDDSVKCWGINGFGQLGLGGKQSHGGTPGSMGENLAAVDLGTGRSAKAIAVGELHSCAILDDDSVKCWGANGSGQLGLGTTTNLGDDPEEMGDYLPSVDLGDNRTATTISLGRYSSCAVLDNGTLKCWGSNANGALGAGLPTTEMIGDLPGEVSQLAPVQLGNNAAVFQLDINHNNNCAVLNNTTIKCWGYNSKFQLGFGQKKWNEVVGDAPEEMGDGLEAVILGPFDVVQSFAGGRSHGCVLLEKTGGPAGNEVKCWGDNTAGQLGLGHPYPRLNDATKPDAGLEAVKFF